jgi:hypothetical protein
MAGLSCKETKITFLTNKSLVHNYALGYSQSCHSGDSELGERRPEEMIKWHRSAIGMDWWRRHGRRLLRRAMAARSRWRSRLGSRFGEGRLNVGKQATVGASLGPRVGAGRLGQRRERAEVRAHRDGGNGGSAEVRAHAGGEGGGFYRRGRGHGGRVSSTLKEGRGVKRESRRSRPAQGVASGWYGGVRPVLAWRNASPSLLGPRAPNDDADLEIRRPGGARGDPDAEVSRGGAARRCVGAV